MSDDERRRAFRERHELREARAFLRRVREDFANREAIERGELDYELENTCNLCWMENFSAVRFLHEIAAPGMSENDLALGVWRRMYEDGPWAWKKKRRRS